MYIPRVLEKRLVDYLENFPVVCVTGPRQSGKSTMLKQCLADRYTYVTMDDYRLVNLFYDDPERFFSTYGDKVIIDEVQKVPELFNYVKRLVDEDRDNYGKFVLTGSSQFTLLASVSESLAGRVGNLSLLPFQLSEVPESLHSESEFRGAFPELVVRDYRLWQDWYAAYVETYLERDVRTISNVGDLRDFRRLLSLLGAQVAQQLNMSTLAKAIGVTIPTIKRWLSILEASYVIYLLPPHYDNLSKRIVKSPKIYFYDTGLPAYLTGVDTFALYDNGPLRGALFENYVIMEVLKRERHNGTHASLYYLRTSNGAELDLIVDRRSTLEFYEIKASMTFKPTMVRHLLNLAPKSGKRRLLYAGESLPFSDDIEILNYREFLAL